MAEEKTLAPIAFIKLDLGGIENDGYFMSCTLPGGTITQQAQHVYNAQGGNDEIHSPTHLQWQPISLARGIDAKKGLYDWFMKIAETGPQANLKEVKLELLDQKKQTIMTWSLEGAWISNYSASGSNAGGDGVAIEQVTVEYTNAKRV